eukprot:COSAG05_NODE_1599_length_4452_cov_2.249024_6_plen_126_part_00
MSTSVDFRSLRRAALAAPTGEADAGANLLSVHTSHLVRETECGFRISNFEFGVACTATDARNVRAWGPITQGQLLMGLGIEARLGQLVAAVGGQEDPRAQVCQPSSSWLQDSEIPRLSGTGQAEV